MAKPVRDKPVKGGGKDKGDKGGKGNKPAPTEPVPDSGAGAVAANAQEGSFKDDPGVQSRYEQQGADGVGNVTGSGGFSSAGVKPRFNVSDK